MKNLENGSIKSLIIQILIFMVTYVAVFPLFDLLYSKIITRTEFVYSIQNHVIQPIILGTLTAIFFWIIDEIAYKKKQKKGNK